MQVKRKSPVRTSRKTFKKQATSPSLEELAKRAMPKWHLAEESAQDSKSTLEVDAVSPKLGEHRASAAVSRSRKSQKTVSERVSDFSSPAPETEVSGLVNMVPDSHEDSRLGAKTQVFEDGEHTGSQG
jgi:hypothetical protein